MRTLKSTRIEHKVKKNDGIVTPTPGKGKADMTTKHDCHRNLFSADKTYEIGVPKDADKTLEEINRFVTIPIKIKN